MTCYFSHGSNITSRHGVDNILLNDLLCLCICIIAVVVLGELYLETFGRSHTVNNSICRHGDCACDGGHRNLCHGLMWVAWNHKKMRSTTEARQLEVDGWSRDCYGAMQ